MLAFQDNVRLTMCVATLITVMTIVQGANLYVEQKIANMGTNVFRAAQVIHRKEDIRNWLRRDAAKRRVFLV